ncbi:calcium-dependent protein kinase [Tanacetum coccineum]
MTYEELKIGHAWLGLKLSETEVKKLMEAADVDGNRTIDYISFRNAADFISSDLDKLEGYVSSLTVKQQVVQTLMLEPTTKISKAVMNYARIMVTLIWKTGLSSMLEGKNMVGEFSNLIVYKNEEKI